MCSPFPLRSEYHIFRAHDNVKWKISILAEGLRPTLLCWAMPTARTRHKGPPGRCLRDMGPITWLIQFARISNLFLLFWSQQLGFNVAGLQQLSPDMQPREQVLYPDTHNVRETGRKDAPRSKNEEDTGT